MHRVEVTLNGDGTYSRLWEDLRSARQSITLQLYYGAPGRMAGTLGEILRERAAAGVRVFILYDAFGTVDIPADELGALRAAKPLIVVLSKGATWVDYQHIRGVGFQHMTPDRFTTKKRSGSVPASIVEGFLKISGIP